MKIERSGATIDSIDKFAPNVDFITEKLSNAKNANKLHWHIVVNNIIMYFRLRR